MQGFNFDPNAAGSPAFTNFAMNPRMQAMGMGNQMRDLQQEMQRAQMGGADPYRMLGYQQQLQDLQGNAQQWLAGNPQLQSAMVPRMGVGSGMAAAAPRMGQGQQNLWEQIIAALGLGGGGGASTPMG